MVLTYLDRYLLRRAVTPMSAVLISTMVAFLMERLMPPLPPLLTVPFGLSAKRAGPGPAMVIGGLVLFGFETATIKGQALVTSSPLPAAVTIGGPASVFASACVATWISSRKRPGQKPVSWLSARLAALLAAITRTLPPRPAP